MKNHPCKLTLVTNRLNTPLEDYLAFVLTAIKAGVTSLQLREKHLPTTNLLCFGKMLKALLDPIHIPLIVNDNIDLCLELDAAGLHLGQSDGDVRNARAKLGPNKIIGLNANNLAQVEFANSLPIDYIGIGAIFPSKHKPDVEKVWGLSELMQAASVSAYPIVAIGGINESNAHFVMQSGASGIAAIGAFHDTVNLEITTQYLKKIVDEV